MNKETLLKEMDLRLDKIRPYLKVDGGDVILVDIIDDFAMVKLVGNCSNCSMSSMTLKIGIEKEIMSHFPDIKGVKEVTEIHE